MAEIVQFFQYSCPIFKNKKTLEVATVCLLITPSNADKSNLSLLPFKRKRSYIRYEVWCNTRVFSCTDTCVLSRLRAFQVHRFLIASFGLVIASVYSPASNLVQRFNDSHLRGLTNNKVVTIFYWAFCTSKDRCWRTQAFFFFFFRVVEWIQRASASTVTNQPHYFQDCT